LPGAPTFAPAQIAAAESGFRRNPFNRALPKKELWEASLTPIPRYITPSYPVWASGSETSPTTRFLANPFEVLIRLRPPQSSAFTRFHYAA
jgi:hypothetical protein